MNDISTKTKVKVYSVAVIPCLLYSIECTTLYRRHIMALTRLQLRHLRYILNIKWQDRVPDVEVLRRAHTVSVEALVTVAQLRWVGHVQRMANNRLPKAVFYWELRQGKRSHGGQKLWFKDVLKRHMKKTGISHDTWEEAAQKVKWRGLLRKATSAVEEQCQHNLRNSDDTLLLNSPSFKSCITLGDRSFKYAGLKLWNELLRDVRYANTVHSFKRLLKTHLFRKAFLP